MTKEQWLLGLHVLGAFLFVSGAVVAGAFHTAALRRARPSEVAFLLRLSRAGVLMVGVGALAALGFGGWLVGDLDLGWGDAWLTWAVVLWVVALALGGIGGRSARRARYLADRLVAEGDQPSRELTRALRQPVALALNYASFAASLAILGLMIWKPT